MIDKYLHGQILNRGFHALTILPRQTRFAMGDGPGLTLRDWMISDYRELGHRFLTISRMASPSSGNLPPKIPPFVIPPTCHFKAGLILQVPTLDTS